jgi:hypothetical protein
MTFTKYTLGAAAVVLALGATAAGAATERVTTSDCIKAAGQVRAAIDANQQSANLKEAKQQQTAGSYYCQSGMFAKGVGFYNQALTLLAQK